MHISRFTVRLRHDSGHITIAVFAGGGVDALGTVQLLLRAEHAPLSAVVWVKERPVCDYCEALASRYVLDSGDGTPLCWAHAVEHYGTATGAREGTGALGIRRLIDVPGSEWGKP